MQEGLKYEFPFASIYTSIPEDACDISLGWFQLGLRHEFGLVSTRIAT